MSNLESKGNSLAFTIDPAPLALGGFALTTFLLSSITSGLVSITIMPAVVAVAWFYGGIIQVLVGLWELAHQRLFQAVTFGSYGAFWLSFAAFQTFFEGKIPAADLGTANALFLGVWVVFTFYMLIASFRTNVALVIAFILVEVLLIPSAIGFATNNLVALHFGGWAGIVLAIVVWYVAAADVINHQFKRTILPLGNLNQAPKAKTAMSLPA